MDDIDFCTLGMFIIDEIDFEPPTPPVKDVIGGAGSYAVVGARIVAGRESSRRVGWIVDTGSDFPNSIQDEISSWETNCVLRANPNRLTTRAWNGYGANEKRDFKYLTPKIRLDHTSLSRPLVFSKSFHMVCSATRCRQIVEGILQTRKELLLEGNYSQAAFQRPIFVWEPVPDLCCPDELPGLYDAIGLVDVVSPNDSELAGYFGRTMWKRNNLDDQKMAEIIVDAGIGPDGQGALVVRAGKHGCYGFSRGRSLNLPACQGVNVVDPTGAGNTFLGALAEAMVCSRQQFFSDIVNSALGQSRPWIDICDVWAEKETVPVAMICATVAASFAIEQVGMPSVSAIEGHEETWNSVAYTERLQQYARGLKDSLEEHGRELPNEID